MKYFTPERWSRMQSGASPKVFEQTYAEWEAAITAYEAELKRILPSGQQFHSFKKFGEEVSLHDAELQETWLAPEGDKLHLLVRPERPESQLYLLVYTLAGPPAIRRGVFPKEYRSECVCWMYDEITLPDGEDGTEEPVFAHNILLSNGCEYEIRFRNLTVTRPQPWPGVEAATNQLSSSLHQTA